MVRCPLRRDIEFTNDAWDCLFSEWRVPRSTLVAHRVAVERGDIE
jgi:hypothetical protein